MSLDACRTQCVGKVDQGCAGFLYSYSAGESGPSTICQLLSEGCTPGDPGSSSIKYYPINQCFDDTQTCDGDPYVKEYCQGSTHD